MPSARPPEPDPPIDLERTAHVLSELSARPSYAFGERRLSSPVAPSAALAAIEALSTEVDHGIGQRARLAARQGLRVHCHEGCVACCNVVVMVWRPESLRVARFLESPEGAEARAWFEAEYPRWHRGLADLLPALAEKSTAYRDQSAYFAALVEATARRVMCAFNRDGRCTIYPVRPLGCRDAHALDTDALCVTEPGSDKKAAAVAFEPLDRLMVDTAKLLRAVHNNMDGTRRHHAEPLCEGVAALLAPT